MPDTSFTAISRFWRDHFRASESAEPNFPWGDAYVLTAPERATIAASIQQFQLGEGSEGRRLLMRGLAYSRATRDPYFIRALRLFIREENRHSAWLLRFMRREGIRSVRKHWVDSVFRVLRGLAGLELSLRVLVTAEIIAVPYYTALRGATSSELLQALCERVLGDEAAHLRFQASMVGRIACGRSPLIALAISRLHRLFLTCTVFVVWMEHKRVFSRAGYTFHRFALEAHLELQALECASALRGSFDPVRLGVASPQNN